MESEKSRFEFGQEVCPNNEETGMLGEILVEGCLLEVGRLLFVVVTYYTGAVVLTVVSLGKLRYAPICTINENVAATRRSGGNLWYRMDKGEKALRAEFVALTGLVAWIAFASLIYFVVGGDVNEVSARQVEVYTAELDVAASHSAR